MDTPYVLATVVQTSGSVYRGPGSRMLVEENLQSHGSINGGCLEGDVRENGNTAIYMAQMGRTSETAAEMSRVFMGVQIQCAQCHDHPSDKWKRADGRHEESG